MGDVAVVDTTGAKETFGFGRDDAAATAYVEGAVDRASSLDEGRVVIAGTGIFMSVAAAAGKARGGRRCITVWRVATRAETVASSWARRESREEDEEIGGGDMTEIGSNTEAEDDASEVRGAPRRATVCSPTVAGGADATDKGERDGRGEAEEGSEA